MDTIREFGVAEAINLAEAANHAKSDFLSRMSHELRTPMNAILGFGQLLELSDLNSDQREGVEYLLKGGRHLLGLINEVLEIARIELGALGVSLEPVALAEVIDECIALMRRLASQLDVKVELQMAERRLVQADRQRLSQVVLNLLSNAVKYNVRGGSVYVKVGTEKSDVVTIEVVDTGSGMSEAMLEKLFTPFDRLGAESSTVEGTELGLVLSKSPRLRRWAARFPSLRRSESARLLPFDCNAQQHSKSRARPRRSCRRSNRARGRRIASS